MFSSFLAEGQTFIYHRLMVVWAGITFAAKDTTEGVQIHLVLVPCAEVRGVSTPFCIPPRS